SRNSRHASPKKSYLADIEACGGCGVVPMRYENSHYVASLQWTIGLELLLLVRNPYQVFLTTDHPNGGPFTSYPHLIRLLMDKSFRNTALETIHPAARERSLLAGLDREYSLEEIAVLTRAAPARILGLEDRGHLRPGGKGDVVFYRPTADWERTFQQAESVWKSGIEVMRHGRLCGDVTTTERLTAGNLSERKLDSRMRAAIEQTLQLPLESLEISEAELPAYAECASMPAPRSTLCSRGTR
ncbi:MAG: amidohydrolase family protein, partial [Pirellulales bacterium]